MKKKIMTGLLLINCICAWVYNWPAWMKMLGLDKKEETHYSVPFNNQDTIIGSGPGNSLTSKSNIIIGSGVTSNK